MMDEELAAIRVRAQAATPGPWARHEYVSSFGIRGEWRHSFFELGDVGLYDNSENEIVFTAHAREDVPALLAEVERLRERLERTESRIEALKSENTNLRELNDAQLFAAAKKIEETRALDTAMREIVERVAHADNSDHGVCYQLCEVRFHERDLDTEYEMRHIEPCIVDKARTVLDEE